MFVINEDDIDSQIESLLKNIDQIEQISIEGQKLIKKRHTVEIRAKEFIEHVKI
jgi:spore maturation protein CgeB